MKKILRLMACLFMVGCGNDVFSDIGNNESFLVVEGWITDRPEKQTISISRSQAFHESRRQNPVTDADVAVFLGAVFSAENRIDYSLNDGGEYSSQSVFQGSESAAYILRVILSNGDTILSNAEIMPVKVELESVRFDTYERPSPDDPDVIEEVFFPVTFSTDPRHKRDYYRYVFYKNGVMFRTPQDIELLDDSAINGNFFSNEFRTIRYNMGDAAKVELRSITRNAFDFLRLLKEQTTLLGTTAGTSPVSIKSNLTNISDPGQRVLGYFSCYSSSTIESTVKR